MAKLYVGLVNTPGLFATIIRKYLKIPYVHVVLGFDPNLEEAYSVGRRFIHLPIIAGFEKEDLDHIAKKYPCATYKIMSVNCSMEQKQQVMDMMRECYENRYTIHYAVFGLIFLLWQKPFFQKRHYTCSSFLGKVLQENHILEFDKDFSLVTPKDFYDREDLDFVFEGGIWNLVRDEYEEAEMEYRSIYRTDGTDVLGAVQR